MPCAPALGGIVRHPSSPKPTRAPAARSRQFGNILLGGKDQHREENTGTLKVHANGFGWKSRKTGNVISIGKADIKGVEWLKVPHAYQLKLRAKGGFLYKFNGFRAQDKDAVKEYCKTQFDVDLEDAHFSYKGWNWGECAIEAGVLTFKVEDKLAIELPLTDVTQATAQGAQNKAKTDAVIEMADDDTALPEDEVLVEMRVRRPRRCHLTTCRLHTCTTGSPRERRGVAHVGCRACGSCTCRPGRRTTWRRARAPRRSWLRSRTRETSRRRARR